RAGLRAGPPACGHCPSRWRARWHSRSLKRPSRAADNHGMPLDGASPRVTLGIATYNRHDYLAEAIRSALEQDFTDLEVLVVLDGTTNPQTDEVLGTFAGEPRLRVVRHETNRGIAAAYN